ncbi:MAG: PAS domain S-box protein, partial [Gemmatimonadetes bacterium]
MSSDSDEWEHFGTMSSSGSSGSDPVPTTSEVEDQLRRALAVLRSALDATVDGILVVDLEGNMVSFNRQFADMWGLSEEVLRERDHEAALREAAELVRDPDGFLQRTRDMIADPEARGADIVELADGRVFERFSQPHRMGDEIVGRVWSFRDLTERVRAEVELRSSEKRYRSLFEDSRQAIYLTTKDGSFIDANPAMLAMFGFDREEMASLNATDLYVDPRARAAFRHAVEHRGSVVKYPVKLRAKDGTEMECLLSSTVWVDGDGEIQGYQGIIENVTERNRAERALRENERKFRSLIERASDTITLLDHDGLIRYVSPSWGRVLGYRPEDVAGKDFLELVHADDRPLALHEFGYLRA